MNAETPYPKNLPRWRLRESTPFWQSPLGLAHTCWLDLVLQDFQRDTFGYLAIVFGLPNLDAMQHCSIHGRMVQGGLGENISFDMHDWPMQDNSVDLIVLPHVLEFASQPQQVLREAVRVLMPEGKLIVAGFNPHSLLHFGAATAGLPPSVAWLSRPRLIDWLRLTGMEIDYGRFGGWRPPVSALSLQRLRWLDSLGEQWWPQAANAYALKAVKRANQMTRLMPSKRATLAGLFAPVANPVPAMKNHKTK